MKLEQPNLSSSEVAYLWISYMVDSMSSCCLKYYLAKCEDKDIRDIIEYALHLSVKHVETVTKLFSEENYPIPEGFTDKDVFIDAPRLFSDEFVLLYLHQMGNAGMFNYSKALSMVAREDVHNFYLECIASSTKLNSKTKKLLLSKGLYVRPPYVPIPSDNETIKKLGFLKGFLGEKRPLTVAEISNCFYNLQTLEIVKVLMIGFAQVAKTKDVQDFFTRATKLTLKQSEDFRKLLSAEHLSSATPWNTLITDTRVAPFTDKLMMFHGAILNGGGVEQYGYSLATGMRRDVGAKYLQLISEMVTFSDDGANLMIKNNWLEQPPLNADHKSN